MEIKYLKEFIVLAKELNYTNAAEVLYISQPVLSKHIKSLEAELGSQLFIRSAKKVSLTEFGKAYCSCAERIVKEYEHSEEMRMNYLNEADKTILLGAILNFQDFGLDKHMIRFSKMHPEYRFEMIEASDKELLALFHEGRLNMFAAGIIRDTKPKFEFVGADTGSIYVYINVEDPLSEKETLTISDLHDRQIFLPYRGTELLAWIEEAAAAAGVELNSKYYGSQEAAKAFVRANMGIALIHIEDSNFKAEPGIKAINLTPPIEYMIGLGYRKKNLKKAEREFLKYALDIASVR